MTIHKEGRKIVVLFFLILLVINLLIFLIFSAGLYVKWFVAIISLMLFIFIVRFFRKPQREILMEDGTIYAPADGTVLVIEETEEPEYFKDKRIQVSIFMSVWNVHINWFPVSGMIKYFKYHPGKFIVARVPKSSIENERTTVVIEDKEKKPVLVRQIAGIIARRIICYAKEGMEVKQNSEMGFIRFGSRVDVFLPLDAKVNVKLGDKTKGTSTILARL